MIDQRIRCQDTHAAAVGQDCETFAVEGPQGRQRLGRIEQLIQVEDSEQSGAPKGRVVDVVTPRHGTGVRGRRLGAFAVTAGLDDDDGFGACGDAGRRHELARVRDRLDVKQDCMGLTVRRQVVEHVAEVHVGHVAERNQFRETNVASVGPIQHRGHDRTGLGHECQVSGARHQMHEACVESQARADHADAVGPDDAQAVGLGDVE